MSNVKFPTLYIGRIIHSITYSELEALPDVVIAVNSSGVIDSIDSIEAKKDLKKIARDRGWVLSEMNITKAKKGEWFMPGFVDTHTHACQFPMIGTGQGEELLDWLKNTIFVGEKKFSHAHYAKKTYRKVVQRTINCGTTTCCYYGTLHLDATKELVNSVHHSGQRAFVGKCNMDVNALDEKYKEHSADTSIQHTKDLIHYIRSLKSELVLPILTPRFALSCSRELLTKLGEMAVEDRTLQIQTHISENKSEVRQTLKTFQDCSSYAEVYNKFGLLGERTILGHGCLLQDSELKLIKAKGAGISHCATSNFNLSSGVARVAEMLHLGMKVGLGTDVSGGFTPSILTEIRHASMASKALEIIPPESPALPFPSLSLEALLYLATLGGARVCSLESTIGNFKVGKQFDALHVSLRPESGNPAVWWEEEDEEDEEEGDGDDEEAKEMVKSKRMLEKFFFCGDDRNIKSVWVKGCSVRTALICDPEK